MSEEKFGIVTIAADREAMTVTTQCIKCHGSGVAVHTIDLASLSEIYWDNPGNKILRIKEVRARWFLGLRAAKDIVEKYDGYLDVLKKWEADFAERKSTANAMFIEQLSKISYGTSRVG